jgi:hypothetical protein
VGIRRRRVALVVAVAFAQAACSSGSAPEGGTVARRPTTIPAGFIETPTAALSACRRLAILVPGCPTIVPRAGYRNPGGPVRLYTVFVSPPSHGFPSSFSLQWRAPSSTNPRRNHPPKFVHVVIYAASRSVTRFRHAFLTGWPTRPAEIADGDVAGLRRTGLALGYVRWNGRRGALALIPPYGYGGMQGEHLVFRWCGDGTDFALGLHAWEPFTETVVDLRRMVEALPPGSSSRRGCRGPGGT